MRYDCVRPETRLPARRDVTHVHTHADDNVGWSTHTLGYVSSRTRFPWNYLITGAALNGNAWTLLRIDFVIIPRCC